MKILRALFMVLDFVITWPIRLLMALYGIIRTGVFCIRRGYTFDDFKEMLDNGVFEGIILGIQYNKNIIKYGKDWRKYVF